jgi:formylglycine-generating enzyme required for sulfatase activity
MVWVPGGWFNMGSPTGNIPGVTPATAFPVNENPQHDIGLKGFWMGKYQVTQELWADVMKDYKGGAYASPSAGSSGAAPGEVQRKRPVTNVNWYTALVFCNLLSAKDGLGRVYKINDSVYPTDWGEIPTATNSPTKAMWDAVTIVPGANGYRLATEAQWEYACRAGTNTVYYEGDTFSGDYGWFTTNSGGQTHEVGKKTKNEFGLYDMHGNVWEWCWDWYDANYYATFTATTNPASPINPVGPVSGTYRVHRGGNYVSAAASLRSAYRGYNYPFSSNYYIGLRIVRP